MDDKNNNNNSLELTVGHLCLPLYFYFIVCVAPSLNVSWDRVSTPHSLQELVTLAFTLSCHQLPATPFLLSLTPVAHNLFSFQPLSAIYLLINLSFPFIFFGSHSLFYPILWIDWNWFHATGTQSCIRVESDTSFRDACMGKRKKRKEKKNTFILLNTSFSDLEATLKATFFV